MTSLRAALTPALLSLACGGCLFPPLTTRPALSALRVVGYPALGTGGGSPWSNWNDADLARASSLGANTVRIDIDPMAFGYPSPTHAADLANAVALAARHGLSVEIALFANDDTYGDASTAATWTQAVLAPIASEGSLAAVSLDVDPGASLATTWAPAVLAAVRRAGVHAPVGFTLRQFAASSAVDALVSALAPATPDWYGAVLDDAFSPVVGSQLATLQAHLAPTPLRVDGAGYPTNVDAMVPMQFGGVPATASGRLAMQDLVVRTVAYASQQLHLASPIGLDLLVDPPAPSDAYGLFAPDGTSRQPLVASVQALYAHGALDTSFNQGFELDAAGVPAQWVYAGAGAVFARDTSQHHGGVASGKITTPTSSPFVQMIALPPAGVFTTAGPHACTASTWIMTSPSSNSQSRVSLAFVDAMGELLDTCADGGDPDSGVVDGGPSGWQQMTATCVAPSNAVAAMVFLKTSNNPGGAWFDDVALDVQ